MITFIHEKIHLDNRKRSIIVILLQEEWETTLIEIMMIINIMIKTSHSEDDNDNGKSNKWSNGPVLFSLSPLSPSFLSIPVLLLPSSTSFLWMFKIKRKTFYITIVLESKIIHICDVSWICNTSFFLNAIPMLTTVITLTRSKGFIRLKLC